MKCTWMQIKKKKVDFLAATVKNKSKESVLNMIGSLCECAALRLVYFTSIQETKAKRKTEEKKEKKVPSHLPVD